MRSKPQHTCFQECAGCAYALGVQDTNKKPNESAKYVWMIVGSDNPCDIRLYAFSHEEGVAQLAHTKGKFKDGLYPNAEWTLFKLVRVKRTSPIQINKSGINEDEKNKISFTSTTALQK